MLNDKNWDLNEVGRTLNKAANLMDERGQAKFVTEDSDGRLCIQGAVYMAISGCSSYCDLGDDSPLSERCFAELNKHLPFNQLGFGDVVAVCHWNNDIKRTKDEAVNLMRTVAATCKSYQPA